LTAAVSALWYAWGQIDAGVGKDLGFNTDHGWEFQRLYSVLDSEMLAGTRSGRPSVLDAWQRFVERKRSMGVAWPVTSDDLDPY
jgi:hypothetical protein